MVKAANEDVGFGPFDRNFLDAGVNGLHEVVGTEVESIDVEGGIRGQTDQMGRVLDGDGGGFVDTLAEFTPETMEKGKKNEKKRKIQLGKKGLVTCLASTWPWPYFRDFWQCWQYPV